MKACVIGDGFIGTHLTKALGRTYSLEDADVIYYCIGVMRNENKDTFYEVNYKMLKELLDKTDKPVIYLSSTQSSQFNDYGYSKRLGESLTLDYPNLFIYRLNNTFGEGAKPNYNSVVSTWLYNIKNDLPIRMDNGNIELIINYVEDTVKCLLDIKRNLISYVEPAYKITLRELADRIYEFKLGILPKDELGNKLYKTYQSY